MTGETTDLATKQPTYNSELKNLPVFLRRVGRWVVLQWPQSRLLIRNGTATMSRGKVACESVAHAIAVKDGLIPTTCKLARKASRTISGERLGSIDPR